MLGWALTFLVIALIAAVLGFGGIAGFAVEIAKIIFFVAIILFVISAVFALIRGRSPTVPLLALNRYPIRERRLISRARPRRELRAWYDPGRSRRRRRWRADPTAGCARD